jgi:hypothetical protein
MGELYASISGFRWEHLGLKTRFVKASTLASRQNLKS